MKKERTITDNRKANYNYTITDRYTSGMVLKGCEVKSIRNGEVNMSDSYCTIANGEMFVKNMHISQYKNADIMSKMDPKRDRKLLLTKRELRKLESAVKIKGVTIVPVRMFINEKGRVKLEIGLAKGKKSYDKSQAIKERDLDREMRSLI